MGSWYNVFALMLDHIPLDIAVCVSEKGRSIAIDVYSGLLAGEMLGCDA